MINTNETTKTKTCAVAASNTVVARRYRTSNATVGKWRTRFIERRLDGLYDEPRVGERRWRLHVVSDDVDTAASEQRGPVSRARAQIEHATRRAGDDRVERRVCRHGEPVAPQDLDLEWLVARRSHLCHELRHVVDAPAFRIASFHLGQHRDPGMRQPRAAREMSWSRSVGVKLVAPWGRTVATEV